MLKTWNKCMKVGVLICIVMLLSGWAGCGGEEETTKPKGDHAITITNWLDIGFGGTKIDIYVDDARRRSNLEYGSSARIPGISSGDHSIGVDASPGQGTMFYRESYWTFSGSGGSYSMWVDEDGIHRYE
jgi:hypothetical protein